MNAALIALVRRALALDELSPAARAIEERAIVRELSEIEKSCRASDLLTPPRR